MFGRAVVVGAIAMGVLVGVTGGNVTHGDVDVGFRVEVEVDLELQIKTLF